MVTTERKGFNWKGCLIGCGVCFLLFFIVSIAGTVWLFKKGEFPVERTLLTPGEGELYIRAHLRPEDAALIDFFSEQTKRLQQIDPVTSSLPPFIQAWRHESNIDKLRSSLPLKVEVLIDAEMKNIRGSVGFSVYNNMAGLGWMGLKWTLRDQGHVLEHAGKEYIRLVESNGAVPVYICLYDDIFYFAVEEPTLQTILERLDAPPGPPDPRSQGLDPNAPLLVVATGSSAQEPWLSVARELVDFQAEQQLPTDPTGTEPGPEQQPPSADPQLALLQQMAETLKSSTRFGIDLIMGDANTMKGKILFDVPNGPEVEAAITHELGAWQENSALTLHYELKPLPSGYQVDYSITGFSEALKSVQEEFQP